MARAAILRATGWLIANGITITDVSLFAGITPSGVSQQGAGRFRVSGCVMSAIENRAIQQGKTRAEAEEVSGRFAELAAIEYAERHPDKVSS